MIREHTPNPRFFQLHDPASAATKAAIQAELSASLLAPQAFVSPKYLYDMLGSRLFDAITELPEYYPTRTEAAIMSTQRDVIARTLPKGAVLIDLGAGSCEKASRLFEVIEPAHYIAIDISVDYLRHTLECLQREYPQMGMSGVGMDFSSRLELPPELLPLIGSHPVIVFYPGSSIGNFNPADAHRLLAQMQALCARGLPGSGLLIGVDAVKPEDLLVPAYDDALGVTASFNLNMLLHLNRLIGTNFDVRDWQHVALFNPKESRIEMHLQARHTTSVRWSGQGRSFARGERIHTENSYKWTPEQFAALLKESGFAVARMMQDDSRWFSVCWATSGNDATALA
jgi:L-histidine Nalpha-methyltransferase